MAHNYSLWHDDKPPSDSQAIKPIQEGAVLLPAFLLPEANKIVELIDEIADEAPFRQMITPGGYRMSVAMTNCGHAGWITARRGYRYDSADPMTGKPWPPMPELFLGIAGRAAAAGGFPNFLPDACLINRYVAGAKLSLHQDKDERDFMHPIVSVSLGLPATFLFGGMHRTDKLRRIRVEHGDIVVWGGPARLIFHGIEPLVAGNHPLLEDCRINLTFRKAL